MFRMIYAGVGGVLIAGYLGWSLMGMEWNRSSPEPIPKVVPGRSSSYSSGRSRHGYYGGGGFSFGK